MKFSFIGNVPSSKSLFNRALVLKSFNSKVLIKGRSNCDDVQLMEQALRDFSLGKKEFFCGSAGTVFRFLALRVSKKSGTYYLKAEQQLLKRPHEDLIKLLSQLSCQAVFDNEGLKITSQGWAFLGDGLHISAEKSSQFASAFLLSAWDLDFPCCISLGESVLSESYLKMTIKLCKLQGMKINYSHTKPYEIYIEKKQKVDPKNIVVEPDMSSAFALSAIAVIEGVIKLNNFPVVSLQGDMVFVQLLKDLGCVISIEIGENHQAVLSVGESNIFKTHFLGYKFSLPKLFFNVDLKTTPDLFPVLAALAGLLMGESSFYNITHIAYKESNRLLEIKKLLISLGREVVLTDNIFIIKAWNSQKQSPALNETIFFDTKEDHRLVMAAYVFKAAGFNIKCSSECAVSKSFPEFLSLTKNLATQQN